MAQPKVVSKGEGTVLMPPAQCLVSKRGDQPMVDFGVDFTGVDPHVYLTVANVEQAARVLGMASEKDFLELREHADDLLAENRGLTAKLAAKPLLNDVFAEHAIRELAFHAAAAAVTPLLADNPDYEFPSERVREEIEVVIADHLGVSTEDKEG